MYAKNVLELRQMPPDREEILPPAVDAAIAAREIMTVLIQHGTNIAVLHEQVSSLKKDTETIRAVSHAHGSELQKIVILEDRCASSLERIEAGHKVIQADVTKLMARDSEVKGAWWLAVKLFAGFAALLGFAAWLLDHHITIGFH